MRNGDVSHCWSLGISFKICRWENILNCDKKQIIVFIFRHFIHSYNLLRANLALYVSTRMRKMWNWSPKIITTPALTFDVTSFRGGNIFRELYITHSTFIRNVWWSERLKWYVDRNNLYPVNTYTTCISCTSFKQ